MNQFQIIDLKKDNQITTLSANGVCPNVICPNIICIPIDIVCGCDPNTYCGGEDIGCENNNVAPRKYI